MKWGRKNSTSSSSGLSSIFQVFPIAWFIKFKEMSSKSKSQPVKSKQKTKPNSSLSSTIPVSFRNTQIYNGDIPGDDDAYWQFSLRREDFEGMKNRGGVRSIWYDSDDECEFRMSSFQSCRSSARKLEAKEETKNFSEMLSDIRNNRNLGGGNREEIVLKTQQKITRMAHKVTNQKLRKTERILQEVGSDSSRESIKLSQASNPESIEKKNMDLEPMAVIGSTKREYSSSDYGLRKYYYNTASNSKNINWKRTINDGDQEFMALNSKKSDQSLEEEEEIAVDSKRKTEREPKVKDFLSKREQQRKSIYICKEVHKRRAKQSCKVCFCSPRTASKTKICKIRALEDMKKDKTKKERTVGVPSLERFAMVKFSFDPQKDFRDSMVEMIVENSIRRSEELENLLACYLSLNSDEYHDLINEVFWQEHDFFNLNHEDELVQLMDPYTTTLQIFAYQFSRHLTSHQLRNIYSSCYFHPHHFWPSAPPFDAF